MRHRLATAFLLLAVQLFPWAVPACAASSALASYTWMADGVKYASALPLIDYGSRMYDPAVARWMSVDPMAEKYYPMGGYNYCAGNPITYRDIWGFEPTKKQAGSATGFFTSINKIKTGIGTSTGLEAHNAMLRMGEVSIKKGKPAPAKTGPFNKIQDRYIYTEKGGWIDMAHFMFYAGTAYRYKVSRERATTLISSREFSSFNHVTQASLLRQSMIDPISETIQDGYVQERMDRIFANHSAYSYEDLPTDIVAAVFGASYFDPNSNLTFAEQILNYLIEELGATNPERAPNFDNLPQDYSKGKPSQTNQSTKPLFTNP